MILGTILEENWKDFEKKLDDDLSNDADSIFY